MIGKKLSLRGLMLLTTILISLGIPSAYATVVFPAGASAAPSDLTSTIGGMVAGKADQTYLGVFLMANVGGVLTATAEGNLTVGVRTDTVSGFDFLYQWTALTNDIVTMSVSDFTGYGGFDAGGVIDPAGTGADVGFADGSKLTLTQLGLFKPIVPDAVNTPARVSRPGASHIDFTYDPAMQAVNTTVILVARIANALSVDLSGSASVIEGGVLTEPAYAPTPEPAKAGLLVGLLFAAGLFVARRFRLVHSS